MSSALYGGGVGVGKQGDDLRRELLRHPGVGQAFLSPSLAGKGAGGRSGLSGSFDGHHGGVGVG